MKKYMLMLAVALIASPALATVTVSVVDNEDLTADITYEVTGEPNNVAAFAVDIAVDGGAVITGISNFHTGVSVAGSAGYGIFPANFDRYITVNGNGDVDDWTPAAYTPAAEAGDKGALGGIGTSGITIELGALYKGDSNAPATSGTLCTITVDKACNADLEGNAIRGGVVLEGAGAPTGTTYVDGPITGAGGEPFPSDDPAYDDWVALGKPDCWALTTQCHGDADGKLEGSAKTGYWRVHFRDLNTLLAGWSTLEPATAPTPSGPGITTVSFTDTLGTVPGVCADFAHDAEGGAKTGFFRVHFSDLTILINSWNIKEPGFGPGLATDCPGSIDPDPVP